MSYGSRIFSSIRRHLSYANVVATMALVFAMGGSAVAAKHYLIVSTSQISPGVLKKLAGKPGTTGPAGQQGVAGAAGTPGSPGKEGLPGEPGPRGKEGPRGEEGKEGPAGAQGPLGAPGREGSPGKEGPAGPSALSSLPSGDSESGDYGMQVPNSGSGGELDEAVTFPIPLAAEIAASNVIYTPIETPVTHCSGPGQAAPGYLCIYSSHNTGVITPPAVLNSEVSAMQEGTGRVGFNLDWAVTAANAFDIGTYTVTAP